MDTYYYTDRVTIKAANGTKRVYLIAYAPDRSGTEAEGITDEKNAYTHTFISPDATTMQLDGVDEDPDAPRSEQVHIIYVKGQNAEPGSSYQLNVPKGSEVKSIIRKGDPEWRYSYQSIYYQYENEAGESIGDYYYYADRITVRAANGTERIYLIAYAQDWSGVVADGITDTGNEYLYTWLSADAESMILNLSEEDPDAPAYEEVYPIYIKGKNKTLGSGYKLNLPEGSEIKNTIRNGETGWRYRDTGRDWSYADKEGQVVSDTYYYTDRVTVRAANGVERIYLIAYASAAEAGQQ